MATRRVSAGNFDAAGAALDNLEAMARGVAKAGEVAADIVARIDNAVSEGRTFLEKQRQGVLCIDSAFLWIGFQSD